ncbi:CapA family protein [Demequina pelophila]|uniref:CapA family protein n=1 Tax=Demequina pelophila TaxID=1638984 RepID=UPI0007861370|nr:CapA family protein [Demequina pelophila]
MPATTSTHARTRRRGLGALVATVVALAAGLGAGALAAWPGSPGTHDGPAVEAATAPSPATEASSPVVTPSPTEPAEPEPVRFTLVAAGDVLTHGPVNRSAASGDSYDFSPLLEGFAPYVEGADLALCHLEVPIAPEGVALSGYPLFAGAPELVRDLAGMGWDGCSTASNHTVDQRFAGLTATLDALDAEGLQHAGSARTEEEAARVAMYEVSDGDQQVTVAQISFTYGLNGLPMPEGRPWAVNVFDADAADARPIIDAAQEARDAGADIVLASVHCCVEYRTAPTDAQRAIATQIAESGLVDLYIGHHAHVPQPIELLPGGPSGDGMWTAFGLGNFLSNQDDHCCVAETSSGVLLSATFELFPGEAPAVDVGWTGVTVDRVSGHRLHALADIADGVGALTADEVAARHARVADAVGGDAPEVTEPVAALAEAVTAVPRVES